MRVIKNLQCNFLEEIGNPQFLLKKFQKAFQEIDYKQFFGSVAKWVCEIDDADRIPELVARAWTTALSGRPGPVIVALPENMLRAAVTQPACGPITLAEPALSHAQKAQLQACLQASKRPVVLYGGSGWTTCRSVIYP